MSMNLLTLSFLLMSLGMSERIPAKCADSKIVSRSSKCSDDTNAIKKRLPVYRAVSCINSLLKDIVKANRAFYDPKEYFYSLSLKREGDRRYLVIETSRYKSSRVFDYIGVIKISGAIFLCRGDIAADTLFKINNDAFLNVCLRGGSEDFDYGLEPSLSGLYQECSEIKIILEVYTRSTLPGYRMEERKNKKTGT